MSGRPSLSHVNERGAMRMVDVSAKAPSERRAVARGTLRLSVATLALLRSGRTKKGDVLAAARLAGIMAAKRTADLIPLCHPLPLTSVKLELEPVEPDAEEIRSEEHTAELHS